MRKILTWIQSHKILTAAICVVVFVLPLVVIHVLFRMEASADWLVATWSAGELLAYIAGFETLLGTVVLGAVTVYQSDRANETSEKLAKENNDLQKISIQQMLPLLKVESITVQKAEALTYDPSYKDGSIQVSEHETLTKREPHIIISLPRTGSHQMYHKEVRCVLKNISSSPISQIIIDRAEFPGFRYKGTVVQDAKCIGIEDCVCMEQVNCIRWLVMPDDQLVVVLDIYFDNALYIKFWELEEATSIGFFNMCLYTTNSSLSGIEYNESIYIEKTEGFKEVIKYRAAPKETGNARDM